MSDSIEELKNELEQRIKSHRPGNPFQPTITHKMKEFPNETVVQYFVDLPDEERREYNNEYFDGDRNWIEGRGDDYDLTAMLYCGWQVSVGGGSQDH
jgi:hypothetical protein